MKKSQQVFCVTVFSHNSTEEICMKNRLTYAKHHFHKKEFTIGSSKKADLMIPHKAIAPLQIKFFYNNGQIFLQKIDAVFETTVSGSVVKEMSPFPYKSGEVVLFSGFDKALYIEVFHQEFKPLERRDEIIKEAMTQAEEIRKQALETEERSKEAADNLLRDVKKQKKLLLDEMDLLTADYEQESTKKSDLEASLRGLGQQFDQCKSDLESVIKEREIAHRDLEISLSETVVAKEAAQKACDEKSRDEKIAAELKTKNDHLQKEIQDFEKVAKELKETIGQLRAREQKEVSLMHEKAELEYERQKKLEHKRMAERLVHENKMLILRKSQEEKLEEERRRIQIQQIARDIIDQLGNRIPIETADHEIVRKAVTKSIHDEYTFRQRTLSQLEMKGMIKSKKVQFWASAAVFMVVFSMALYLHFL